MSNVRLLECPICNPEARDFPVRKTVNVTSEELVNLIKHVIEAHSNTEAFDTAERANMTANEAQATADEALKLVKAVDARVFDNPTTTNG